METSNTMNAKHVVLLFDIHVPGENTDLVRLKAGRFCEKLEGLGFRTFVSRLVSTIPKEWEEGVWAEEVKAMGPGFIGTHAKVLAIRIVESWRYKQAILKDLHTLKILPQEGIKLKDIKAIKPYVETTPSGYKIKRDDSVIWNERLGFGFRRSDWIRWRRDGF